MPEKSPFEPSGYNCLLGMIGMGSFVAGLYHGLSDAKGVPMNPGLEDTLMYLPSVVGGFAGTSLPARLKNFLPQPSQQAPEGCNGCMGFVSGALVTGAWNVAGYGLGRILG
jgi:hypothetical protein